MSVEAAIAVPHQVVRWSIDTGTSFEDFRSRYEAAVPELDSAGLVQLRRVHASWDQVVAAAAINAPNGFVRFWSTDVAGVMQLAGSAGPCASYLMGNHTIAEKMYRHDPAVMLYAPLRTAIYRDAQGSTRFLIDQPSTRFSTFENPAITAVGKELDRKILGLLEVLDVPIPETVVADWVHP